MELPRHGHTIQAQVPGISHRHREMKVPPTTTWQGFQFEMGKTLNCFPVARFNVAGVKEN